MTEDIFILLPSLIHRIGGDRAKQAKTIALQCDCQLKRVRRSRNWVVSGKAMSIQSFTEQLRADSDEGFSYLIKKIVTALLGHADKLEPLDAKLARLINQTPSITLGELIQLTQCTMAEARVARFNADL
ncbi:MULTISPECIES: ribosome recycling factor family protein [Shewanella]|uniref:ribosome recycling factor family protein n=1 Tax=unclassified Shewanella TaxID=196818 RepID=UPI0010C0764C|nr:ribosome recycling factor family protein [Shewanella sp. MEBiC00475]